MYIIIICLLVAVVLFLINSRILNGLRGKYQRTLEFFISLISTFIGFFIALSLNTILSDINQKKNLVKVLNATNLSIENCEMKTRGMYLIPAKKGIDINEIIQYSPVEMPKLYNNLESNPLVSDYFSSNAFQAYILCSDNMNTFVKNVNAGNIPAKNKVQLLEKYLKYLDLAKKVNALEINKLKGETSQSAEDEELERLTQEIISK